MLFITKVRVNDAPAGDDDAVFTTGEMGEFMPASSQHLSWVK
jgi:hypothetical protein